MDAQEYLSGKLLLIDKPLHWTSFQVVNKIRHILKRKFQIKKIKVGHAGTLDPLATGLLLICTGKMTKQITQFQMLQKEYTGAFCLGATTPSFDLETEIDNQYPTEHISESLILNTASQFEGEISQKPPMYSAVKKEGKRLYELAREGKTIDVPSRKVTIHSFKITKIELPYVHFKVVCSKGTYIRSLAYDFGRQINSGAHLTELRRTKIGTHDVTNAHPPTYKEELEDV